MIVVCMQELFWQTSLGLLEQSYKARGQAQVCLQILNSNAWIQEFFDKFFRVVGRINNASSGMSANAQLLIPSFVKYMRVKPLTKVTSNCKFAYYH
jgi:hypothetical protein